MVETRRQALLRRLDALSDQSLNDETTNELISEQPLREQPLREEPLREETLSVRAQPLSESLRDLPNDESFMVADDLRSELIYATVVETLNDVIGLVQNPVNVVNQFPFSTLLVGV